MNDEEQRNLDSKTDLTKTKPMTYFLYPKLHASELKLFLEEHRASGACVNKALVDVHIYNPNASHLIADDIQSSSQQADDTNNSRLSVDTNISRDLSADVTNLSRDLSALEGTSTSRLSSDDVSLDWFEDTCDLIQPTHNCFQCTLMNNGAVEKQMCPDLPASSSTDLNDNKDKPVKLGKKKAVHEFFTSVLRQIRNQLMPNCANSEDLIV